VFTWYGRVQENYVSPWTDIRESRLGAFQGSLNRIAIIDVVDARQNQKYVLYNRDWSNTWYRLRNITYHSTASEKRAAIVAHLAAVLPVIRDSAFESIWNSWSVV